jgi:hypothetical protein
MIDFGEFSLIKKHPVTSRDYLLSNIATCRQFICIADDLKWLAWHTDGGHLH